MDLNGHFHTASLPDDSPPSVSSAFAAPYSSPQPPPAIPPIPPSIPQAPDDSIRGDPEEAASMADQAAGGLGVGSRGSGKLPRTYSWPERPQSVVRSRKQVRVDHSQVHRYVSWATSARHLHAHRNLSHRALDRHERCCAASISIAQALLLAHVHAQGLSIISSPGSHIEIRAHLSSCCIQGTGPLHHYSFSQCSCS